MSNSRKKENVVVAISYNPVTGGAASDSVRKLMHEIGTTVYEIDYRKIVPATPDLEEIYANKEKLFAALIEAKQQAVIFLEKADCLILPGNGVQVDTRLFGNELEKDEKIDLPRAIAEMALAHVAMQRGMPILAICGGHQILNVYLGGETGSLSYDDIGEQGYLNYAYIALRPDAELKKIFYPSYPADPDSFFFGAHQTVVTKVSDEQLTNKDKFLAIVALADDKSHSIEAIEAKYGAPLYSLQFHPEVGVLGMYSYMLKAIAYQAQTSEEIEVNLKIFKAIKQAAETFKQKKAIHVSILQKNKMSFLGEAKEENKQQEKPQINSTISKIKTHKPETQNKTIKQNKSSQKENNPSFRSLFSESKTSDSDSAENKVITPFKKK